MVQQSPTIVYLLAQLENNRKQVVLSDGDATYVDTRTGNIVISKSFLVRDDIGALATVLAHEGGHAILKDGTLNFLVARTADDAVHMALMREAVALRAEFLSALELGTTMHSGSVLQQQLSALVGRTDLSPEAYNAAANQIAMDYTAALTPSGEIERRKGELVVPNLTLSFG